MWSFSTWKCIHLSCCILRQFFDSTYMGISTISLTHEIRSTQQVQKRLWEIKPSFCQVLGKTEFFCFCLYIDFKVIVYPSPSIQPFLDLYFQVLSLSTSFWSEGSAKGIRGYGMQIDDKMISKPIRCKRCFSVLFICFDVDNREKVSLRHENYFVLLTLS